MTDDRTYDQALADVFGGVTSTGEASGDFYPCGCLTNDRGAHRGDCPDFETVRVGDKGTSNRLDDLTWKPRSA